MLATRGFNLRPPPPNSVTYVVETYTRLGATFKKLDIIKLEWPIAYPHTRRRHPIANILILVKLIIHTLVR